MHLDNIVLINSNLVSRYYNIVLTACAYMQIVLRFLFN